MLFGDGGTDRMWGCGASRSAYTKPVHIIVNTSQWILLLLCMSWFVDSIDLSAAFLLPPHALNSPGAASASKFIVMWDHSYLFMAHYDLSRFHFFVCGRWKWASWAVGGGRWTRGKQFIKCQKWPKLKHVSIGHSPMLLVHTINFIRGHHNRCLLDLVSGFSFTCLPFLYCLFRWQLFLALFSVFFLIRFDFSQFLSRFLSIFSS